MHVCGSVKRKERRMITKEMTVHDVLSMGKQYGEVFDRFLLTCVGCPGAQMETLEEAAKGHGVDLDALLSALNQA